MHKLDIITSSDDVSLVLFSRPNTMCSTTCWAETLMDLARNQTQHPWAQLHAKPKHLQVWQDTRANLFGFSYMLSPSTCGSGKMRDSILSGLATCWAQVPVGLARCETQSSRAWLHTEPKYLWVWQDTKLKPRRFILTQVHMYLTQCQILG